MIIKESINFERGAGVKRALGVGYNQLRFTITKEIKDLMDLNEEEDRDLTADIWRAAVKKEFPDKSFTFFGDFYNFKYYFNHDTEISKSIEFILDHLAILKTGMLIPPKNAVPEWFEDDYEKGELQYPYKLVRPSIIMMFTQNYNVPNPTTNPYDFLFFVEDSLITYDYS